METALATHDGIIRSLRETHRGYVFSTGGDGFAVAFEQPQSAVDAAVEAQQTLGRQAWPGQLELRTRMGIHTG
jgi:class 3 adenylate cyclase